jgi:hypothetical protein
MMIYLPCIYGCGVSQWRGYDKLFSSDARSRFNFSRLVSSRLVSSSSNTSIPHPSLHYTNTITMVLPTGLYRADHVGSFLRPKEILQIREDIVSKKATKEDLRKAEDKHITSLVKAELENGIRSVTDGEMRRVSWPFWGENAVLRPVSGLF